MEQIVVDLIPLKSPHMLALEFLFGDVISFTDSVSFCHYLGGDLHCKLWEESKKNPK